MFPTTLSERLDSLIDDLILEGGVESASLASILLASKDSMNRNYLGALSRQVWAANNELNAEYARKQAMRALIDSADTPCECCQTA
jgi:hypothetical protein